MGVGSTLLFSIAFLEQFSEANTLERSGAPPDTWTCQPDASVFQDYCTKYAVPKSFAMTANCSIWTQMHGVSDATNNALQKCQQAAGGRECFTYDNNGRNCFGTCAHHWPRVGVAKVWQRYCSSRSAQKAWYMTEDCGKYGFDLQNEDLSAARSIAKENCEKYAKGMPCQLFDDGGMSLGPRCMPACKQLQPEWCWATATAELASYWNPAKFPPKGDDCTGMECEIAAYKTKEDCCSNKSSCNAPNAIATDYLQDVVGAPAYKGTPGHLTEAQLQAALALGPVAVRIAWNAWPGAHFVTVAGVNRAVSPASYFLHDPLVGNQAGKYQDVSYLHIQVYQEPKPGKNGSRYTGNWSGTYYVANASFPDEVVAV